VSAKFHLTNKTLHLLVAVLILLTSVPMHRGFYKGATGLRWSRGLTITSEAQGYSDLVRAIEKHTGLKTS
jgi:hypothetical protein